MLADGQTQQEIARLCRNKSVMPLDFVNNSIVEQGGMEIINKIKYKQLFSRSRLID